MSNNLSTMFGGTFRRNGFTVKETDDSIEFQNDFLKGSLTCKKPFTVTWKVKKGYELLDVPIGVGNVSAQFMSTGAVLNFLQRRLVYKKK